jgi:hypothetical protein
MFLIVFLVTFYLFDWYSLFLFCLFFFAFIHLTSISGSGQSGHERHVVGITFASFDKERYRVNPHSGAYENRPTYTVKNATDLDAHSMFCSTYREKKDDIPNTSNNWVCSDFQQKRIVPTHCVIRSHGDAPAGSHVKIWLVETSVDGENWQEVAREEANRQLKGKLLTDTFKVVGSGECCFIRLVNIGIDHMVTSVCEIFGSLFEEITDSSDIVFLFCFCFPPA